MLRAAKPVMLRDAHPSFFVQHDRRSAHPLPSKVNSWSSAGE
jgi:hypothetical protein